jgi:hypothetical protein
MARGAIAGAHGVAGRPEVGHRALALNLRDRPTRVTVAGRPARPPRRASVAP